MKKSIVFLGLIAVSLFVPNAFAEKRPEKTAEKPTAFVYPAECRFSFPIERVNRKWRWGVSTPNFCEYSWMVTIKTETEIYQLGFSYFNPGGPSQEGSFADLLFAGQTDLWKLGTDSASSVDGVKVKATVDSNRLRITVVDKEWTERLFEKKPKSLQFETTGTQLGKSKKDVVVKYYKSPAKPNPKQSP